MGMKGSVRMGFAALACAILSACAGTADGGPQGGDFDCVSHYCHRRKCFHLGRLEGRDVAL